METLEEAAERIYPMVSNEYLWHVPIETRKIFIKGAKWQQEQICNSEVIQKIRASKSDAEARRIIRTI